MLLTDGCQEVPAGKALEWGRGLSYCRIGQYKAHFIGVWFCEGAAGSSERDQPVAPVAGAAGAVRMAAACVVPIQGQRRLVWSNAWFITKADSTKDNDKKLSVCYLKVPPYFVPGCWQFGQEAGSEQKNWFYRYQTSALTEQSILRSSEH